MSTSRASRLVVAIFASAFLMAVIGCRHKILVKAPVGKTDSVGGLNPATIDPGQYTVDDYLNQKLAYDNFVKPATLNLEAAKVARNDIAYGIMTQIEILYSARYQRLFGGKNSVAIIGDFVVLGLTSASTIATHTATKTILSALGTGFSGLNLSIDKNYYSQQSFQIIGIAMQTRRDKIRAVIFSNLKEDVSVYPLNAAKRDLITYLQAGTLASGLQELQEEAGAATAKDKTVGTDTVPSAPTGLTVNSGTTENILIWSSVPGAKSYTVYYSTTAGVTKAASKLPSLQVPLATHSGLPPGAVYFYAVSATNDAGESPLSSEVQGRLLPLGSVVPVGGIVAPQNLHALSFGAQVLVSWTGSAGADHYIVNRIVSGSSTVLDSTVKGIAYTDTSAGASKTAQYSVIAVPASGASSAESERATPKDFVLDLPQADIMYTQHLKLQSTPH